MQPTRFGQMSLAGSMVVTGRLQGMECPFQPKTSPKWPMDYVPGVHPLPGCRSKTADSLWHPPPSPCSPEQVLAPRGHQPPEFSFIGTGSTAHADQKLLRCGVKNDTGIVQGSVFIARTSSSNQAQFPFLPSHFDVALPWERSPSQALGRPNWSLLGEAKSSIKKFHLQTHA